MLGFKQLALIGSTASGKTTLAVKIAHAHNAYILSLDSLSVYKEVNIVSAKPTQDVQKGIKHFGIDHLFPNEAFDVTIFIKLYKDVHKLCQEKNKNLIIVGGTSFYLKILLEGISERPLLSNTQAKEIRMHMKNPMAVYEMLAKCDPLYMKRIEPKDTYRITKALEVYLATGKIPSIYFKTNPPKPIIVEPLPLYEIVWKRDMLRKRIEQRTKQMIQEGLIDEVFSLEKKYTRAPNCMKAIGIKETLAYLDGIYNKVALMDKIMINTGRLAKRQETFNRSQFNKAIRRNTEELETLLLDHPFKGFREK
ncbi:MAG: tRNA (adenosine(37)-N6)-dimethylallyltransferase MiaA [Sulfurovum sp.]|nr:tRNA (adenosine(37)-N6)-dimethylallyltransferase MiaA [Sulfurovum sp.]